MEQTHTIVNVEVNDYTKCELQPEPKTELHKENCECLYVCVCVCDHLKIAKYCKIQSQVTGEMTVRYQREKTKQKEKKNENDNDEKMLMVFLVAFHCTHTVEQNTLICVYCMCVFFLFFSTRKRSENKNK